MAPSAYFVGIAAIIVSGIMLKKPGCLPGPGAFVMELPAYHLPTVGNVLRSMWGAGLVLHQEGGNRDSPVRHRPLVPAGLRRGNGRFGMVEDLNHSILAVIGSGIAWLFTPLGWGNWQSAVATITGLIAKENVVGTFGVLFGGFDEVAENGWQIWANMGRYLPPCPPIPSWYSTCCAPLLRGDGRHQAGDEFRQMDLLRHRLSMRVRVCDVFDCVSTGQAVHRNGSVPAPLWPSPRSRLSSRICFSPPRRGQGCGQKKN